MDCTSFPLCLRSVAQAPDLNPSLGLRALFLSQAAPYCYLLRGSSGLASGPLASRAEATPKKELADSHPNSQQARCWEYSGCDRSQPVSSVRSPASPPWALPTMLGPSLSLTHLLTTSGLLCYSACCLGECVCARACTHACTRIHVHLHACVHCFGKRTL